MKIVKMILMSLLVILSQNNCSEKWSEYHGSMDWNEAQEKCAGWFWERTMRLPTRDELIAAHKSDFTQPWSKNGWFYWSSDSYSDDLAYYFGINYGQVSATAKANNLHVRCLR